MNVPGILYGSLEWEGGVSNGEGRCTGGVLGGEVVGEIGVGM